MDNSDEKNSRSAGNPPPYPGYPPGPPPPGVVVNQQPPVVVGPSNVVMGTTGVVVGGHGVVVGQPGVVVGGPGVVVGGGVYPVMVGQQMGSRPTAYTCKSCGAQIVTRVDQKPTTRTHLFALLLCLVGCWPCVCIPYCMDSCQSADHYCPNCNAYIGSYVN